jgi:5-oxoprolinase (ATP-hydrolysing)
MNSKPILSRTTESASGRQAEPTFIAADRQQRHWQIWIDTGGTFTDGVAISPAGERKNVKILSTSALRGTVVRSISPTRLEVRESWSAPAGLIRGFRFRLLGSEHEEIRVERYDPDSHLLELSSPLEQEAAPGASFEVISEEEAPLLATRLLTQTPSDAPLPQCGMRLATTLGTNALLQRRGAPTALFITSGFEDLLLIGNQQRPDLFSLRIDKPEPLYSAVIAVPERLDRNGNVLEPLDLGSIVQQDVKVAAVALLHSYRNPQHEIELKKRLLEIGFEHVSISSELAPRIKLLPRAHTAVVDAYLSPVIQEYLDRVRTSLGGGRLLVMTSAGGLLDPESYRPKDSLLSGPAGGVVGGALAGRMAGFDMGGTSTDVARFDGDYEYSYEHRVGDAHLAAPSLAIESVAAGGGSICWLDGERLRVGPQSAGASPGPACYGAGGPLTLTDVNLLLGRLDAARFGIPVGTAPARHRIAEMRERLTERAADEQLLSGLLAIANETMADAIRRVSLRRGYDPAEYALVAFGGAGGQHACGVAECLAIREVVIPPDAALLSAVGMGHAVVERFVERQLLEPLKTGWNKVARRMKKLAGNAVDAVEAAGIPRDAIQVRRRILNLRFAGQDSSLEIEWRPRISIRKAFEKRYSELFGHRPGQRSVEMESMRVVASSLPPPHAEPGASPEELRAVPSGETRAYFDGEWRTVPTYEREELEPGACFEGPALVFERHSATVVEAAWNGKIDGHGAILLERSGLATSATEESRPEAVRLELFTQRFFTLVKEMGERLERTAVSTNVKERLDFSCALLDPQGELVANAPHIPVHLGSLGICVRRLAESLTMRPGDCVATNHPDFGGSHLPDVTVVTPVYSDLEDDGLLGYVASRAHHAEIGGILPGSMPPAATNLAEEGVVIPPLRLLDAGRPRWDGIRELLKTGLYPSRKVEDNLSDLQAAVAANHAGAEALRALAVQHGVKTVLHYMARLKRLAEERIRDALRSIPDGSYEAQESMDDGTPLNVRIELSGDGAAIDFEGSAGVHDGNLNATPAIVHSAVIYFLRLLLREPLPLNEGLLRAVSLSIPHGILSPSFEDDPRLSPAIVGGNVETSQRLVDTLLKALRLAACSQGTMNNVIFGNERCGYYETLGGGCGAGRDFHGASAVHSHMTNTRITDPEILEHRYPMRVQRFAIRRGSGGGGLLRGGDGLVRELLFLEPGSLSLLTQHRVVSPYGMAGGAAGACGSQRVERAGGEVLTLGPIDGCDVGAGDRLIIETPGGGGYGVPSHGGAKNGPG